MFIKKINVALIGFVFLFSSNSFAANEKAPTEVKSTKNEVIIINLLNAVGLTRQQQEFLLEKAHELQDAKKVFLDSTNKLREKMRNSYMQIKEEKLGNEDNANKDFVDQKKEFRSAEKKYNNDINRISLQVQYSLEQYQKMVIEGYKPCVISNEDLNIISQSQQPVFIFEALDNVKSLGQAQYDKQKDKIIIGLIKQAESQGNRNPNYKSPQFKEMISNVFSQARDSDDVEYVLDKQKMVQQILELIRPDIQRETQLKEKIIRLLLSDEIIGVLEERLNR